MNAIMQTVILDQPSPFTVVVAWRNARRERGIFEIDFTYEEGLKPRDCAPAAELVTLHHILYPDPMQGIHNIPAVHRPWLYVSHPETLGVVNKTSSCAGAYPYANFVRVHQPRENVLLASQMCPPPWDEDFDFEDAPPMGEPEPFMVKPRQRAPALVVWIEGLGAVGVTEHAVERLCQFEPGTSFPLRSLMRQLAHPGLVEVELPPVVMKHKMTKYSDSRDLECWRHLEGNRLFLFMRGKHYRTLMTLVDLPPRRLHEHVQKGTKPAAPCPYEAMMRL